MSVSVGVPFVIVIGETEINQALATCSDLEVWPKVYTTYQDFFTDSAGTIPDDVPSTVLIVSDTVPDTAMTRFDSFIRAMRQLAVAICWNPASAAPIAGLVPVVQLPVTLNGLRKAISDRVGGWGGPVAGGDVPIYVRGYQEVLTEGGPTGGPTGGGLLRQALQQFNPESFPSVTQTTTPASPLSSPMSPTDSVATPEVPTPEEASLQGNWTPLETPSSQPPSPSIQVPPSSESTQAPLLLESTAAAPTVPVEGGWQKNWTSPEASLSSPTTPPSIQAPPSPESMSSSPTTPSTISAEGGWATVGGDESLDLISAASSALRQMLGPAYDTGETPAAPSASANPDASVVNPIDSPPPAFVDSNPPVTRPISPPPTAFTNPDVIVGMSSGSAFGTVDANDWTRTDPQQSWPTGGLEQRPPQLSPSPSFQLSQPPSPQPSPSPQLSQPPSFSYAPPQGSPLGGFPDQNRAVGTGFAQFDNGLNQSTHVRGCTVVTFWSSKGGVGKTTTAMNTAARLAIADVPTCLVDLDVTSGDAFTRAFSPEHFKTKLPITILDIIAQPRLDQSWLAENLPREPSTGFYMVLAPRKSQHATDARLLGPATYDRLLRVLRQMFEVVILDCPSGLKEDLVPGFALPKADTICCVIDNERSALINLRQSLVTITETPGLGIPKERIGLFLNQQVDLADASAAIKRHTIETFLPEYPIIAEVSHRAEDHRRAANRSELMVSRGDPEMTAAIESAIAALLPRLDIRVDAMSRTVPTDRGARTKQPKNSNSSIGQWLVNNSSLLSKLKRPPR
jgi:MinD-like ATPase involved in chromosome partitioning or flagellar assembly